MKLYKYSLIVMSMLIAMALCSGCSEKRTDLFQALTEAESTYTDQETVESVKNETEGNIYVQVLGAVEKPGIVSLPVGSRVFEAVLEAGGLTADAEERSINQAQMLEDGQQIVVLTKEEMENQEVIVSPGTKTQEAEGKININTASKEELMTLSGIGEAKAADIIAYRESNGRFETIEDIKKISGIKDAIFFKIQDQIIV